MIDLCSIHGNLCLNKKRKTMKKIYQNPETKIVKIQTANMIAVSNINTYGEDATGPGMSRRGNNVWDEEDEEEY